MQRFLWLDLETTGLSPTDDKIVEVAWTVSDQHFRNILPIQSFVITPSVATWGLIKQSPFIQEMHGSTGLLNEMGGDGTIPLPRIAEWILADLDLFHEEGDTWHLAGASIHFDRAFMDVHMRSVTKRLHHRILDTSTLKMLAMASGASVKSARNSSPHRAGFDIAESLDYAVNFKRAMHRPRIHSRFLEGLA